MSVNIHNLEQKLIEISESNNFEYESDKIIRSLIKNRPGVDSVGSILRFMENHPGIEYGMPGSLVHFVERFYKKGYEELLLKSVKRKPTMHTIWMLNRIINDIVDADVLQKMYGVMSQASCNKEASVEARKLAKELCDQLSDRL